MARVKRGVTSHAKHKKTLDAAKGFYGRRKNTIRAAKAAVDRSMQYATRDRKVRKRTKAAQPVKDKEGDVQMADASVPAPAASSSSTAAVESTAEVEQSKPVAGAELEDESVYREKEGKELDALIPEDVKQDVGCSTTGQYELVGEHLYLAHRWTWEFLRRSLLCT